MLRHKFFYALLFGVLIFLIGLFFGSSLGKGKVVTNLPKPLQSTQQSNPTPTQKPTAGSTYQENEPDNSFEQAVSLPLGIDIQGSVNSPGDVDFYSFPVELPARVRFTLTNLPSEYQLIVYNPRRQMIGSSDRTGFLDTISTIQVQETGKYYVQITGKKTNINTLPYTIRVSILPFFE